MILYGVPLSPFVQRVLLAARLKGHELALDPLPGVSAGSPEFAAISPMRRIPVLRDGDLHVCESAVIVTHLDEVLGGPPLLPPDAAGRSRARAIAQIVDCEFVAGLRPYAAQAFGVEPEPVVLQAAHAQIGRGLDAIEQLLDADGRTPREAGRRSPTWR